MRPFIQPIALPFASACAACSVTSSVRESREDCSATREPVGNLLLAEFRPQVGTPHAIKAVRDFAWLIEHDVVGAQGCTHGTAGITSCGLYPYAIEDVLTQQLAVRHAVKRHTAGKTEILFSRALCHTAGEFQHHFFRYCLDGCCQIHLTLFESRFRFARRTAKQRIEALIGHRQPGTVVEVAHVERKRAVILDVDKVIFHQLGVSRFAVWREPHHFVLAAVDLEARVIGDCGVEQPQ